MINLWGNHASEAGKNRPPSGLLSRLAGLPAPKTWLAYMLAVAAILLATVVRWWLGMIFGSTFSPFATFYPMVMFAALFGGTGPGLLGSALAAFAADYFFLPPPGWGISQPADQIGFALFCGINVSVSLVCGALRSARHRSFAEARRAEASEERFRLFMDHTPTLTWVKDDQGRYVYLNRAYEQRFGVSLNEYQGRTDAELWPPEVAARLQEADRTVLAAGHPIEVTEDTIDPGGARSFWLNTKFPFSDASGKRFIASVGLDITDRKRDEEALREQAQLAHLRADATQAMQNPSGLNELLQKVAALLVERLDGAFARVWTVDGTGEVLELQASAGLYTHLDGAHARVPVGHLKIGRIAQEQRPLVTNQVIGDPHVPEQEWARREGLVAFAGFPLVLDGRLLGVVAFFARHALTPAAIETFGAIAGILGQALGRKRAEQSLLRSERRLRVFFESDMVGVFYWNMNGQVTDANNKLLELLRYSREDLPRLRRNDLSPPEFAALDEQALNQLNATGVHTPYEKELLRKDGSRVPVLIGAAMVDDKRQEGVAFVVDVTERMRFEQAVQDSEARLRLAVETAELGMYERDLNTNKLKMNVTCRAILGVSDECPPADAMRRSVHPDDRERVYAAVARSFDPAAREICAAEFRIVRADGSLRWVAGRGRVIFDDTAIPPQPARFVGVLNDITERKLAEQQLLNAKDQLARANQELEKKVRERTAKLEETVAELEHFSYTITHDMRAPLRAMTGFAGILAAAHAPDLPAQGRDLLRRISDAALRMDHLITDALNYSRILQSQLDLRPLDPGPILRGIVESYPQFQPPHAEIHIQPDLPVVLANEAGLIQCFSNLFGNAVKFVAPGVIPRIRVWAEMLDRWGRDVPAPGTPSANSQARHGATEHGARVCATAPPAAASPTPSGKSVRIWVEDNGIGIPPEYHEQIWQMFHRLSKNYEGTGIGLALVHKVVERMNGAVGVESEPGQGSRFCVQLHSADSPQEVPENLPTEIISHIE